MKKLKEILFLSDKGYTDLKKAIIACTITNLAMLLPFCITVMVFSELLNPFLGQELDWQNIWLLWGAGIISAIIVFLASKNDYRKTYIASYKESNVTRLRIAEHLRKLPMSFFNTKDLSELTTNMMSDCSSMDYIIREIKKEEYDLLNDFLYNAIYIPDGVEPPPKSIINCPELQEYVFEFGKRKDDRALVAEVQGNVVGAIWVRIMNDYGHIDNDTPSLAMSVFQKYRGQGIGTSLLQQLLLVEKTSGYSKLSLSVQKNNYAVKMYKKAGFLVVDENSEEYIMTVNL